jgi:hypothetical protein
MKYTEFVKANYDKVANLPAKQRMAKLGQMWKASGHSSSKGKGVVGGSEGGMFIKRKGGKGRKMSKVRGKGIISDALGAFGLGMPEGKGIAGGSDEGKGMKKRGRKPKGKGVAGGEVEGGNMADDALGTFMNFGNLMKSLTSHLSGRGVAGGEVGGKGVAGGEVEGKGIISDTLGAFGLGMKKRGRKPKGKGVVGGDVAGGSKGGGIFSGILGAIGLGMPEKVKQKHFNRMIALDKELHSKGKLSPVQHNKLKVYHTLHGAGFFDSLFSGLKKGVSAVASVVPHAITAIPQVLKVVPEIAKFVPAVGKLAGPLAKVAPLAALL